MDCDLTLLMCTENSREKKQWRKALGKTVEKNIGKSIGENSGEKHWEKTVAKVKFRVLRGGDQELRRSPTNRGKVARFQTWIFKSNFLLHLIALVVTNL